MEKFRELIHLLVTVFLSTFATLIVIPAITDVTMVAVCPGQDECSLAIYLSGFQQAIIGLGTVVMMPLIGNLSDQYGRKVLLTLPVTLSIIPSVPIRNGSKTSCWLEGNTCRRRSNICKSSRCNEGCWWCEATGCCSSCRCYSWTEKRIK